MTGNSMQKLFVNGVAQTLNCLQPQAEAFFVNDENFVLVGDNNEILSMKNSETEVHDLKNCTVLPAFCDVCLKLDKLFEQKENIKFSEFKTAFLKLQNEYLSVGITTVWCREISDTYFKFLEKLSEQSLIKLDIICYVNFSANKNLMDENCRSYRKYKNHLRLGGYTVSLDGLLSDGKANLEKPYKHSHRFCGYQMLVDEALVFVIKTALEEKKQLVVRANGDRAVEQFLRCYGEALEKVEDKQDNYKILLESSGIIKAKQLKKLKEYEIGLMLDLSDYKANYKKIKLLVGNRRVKNALKLKRYFENGLKLILPIFENDLFKTVAFLKGSNNDEISKVLVKQNLQIEQILNSLISASAYFSFEEGQKGSLESGKKANFVVMNGEITSLESQPILLQTYINGEIIFDKNKTKK